MAMTLTIKAYEATGIYLGTSLPHGAPPNWANAMKLGKFRQVPEIIKRAKRHLDRIHSSGFTRRSFWPIPMHWLFDPNTAALLCCSIRVVMGRQQVSILDHGRLEIWTDSYLILFTT